MLIILLIAKFLHHSLYNIISIVWFEVKKQVMKYNNTLEYINLMYSYLNWIALLILNGIYTKKHVNDAT